MNTTGFLLMLAALFLGYEALKLINAPTSVNASNALPAVSEQPATNNPASNLVPGGNSAWGQPNGVTAWNAIGQASQITGIQLDMQSLEKLLNLENGTLNPCAASGEPNRACGLPVKPGVGNGLFQMLPSTFQANALSGHGNIFNPVDNAIAALRYIKSRYGTAQAALAHESQGWY